jgi:hypothetical protein
VKCYDSIQKNTQQNLFNELVRIASVDIAAQTLGITATDEEKKNEAARFEAATKKPEVLECVKKNYEKNKDRYDSFFVAPRILEGRIMERFAQELKINDPQRKKAQELFDEVKKNPDKKLSEYADDSSIFYATGIFPPKSELLNLPPGVAESKNLQNTKALTKNEREVYGSDPFYTQALQTTQQGQFASHITENESFYQLVRVISRKKAGDSIVPDISFEVLSIAKAEFAPWFEKLIEGTKATVFDTALYGIFQEYGGGMKGISIVNGNR